MSQDESNVPPQPAQTTIPQATVTNGKPGLIGTLAGSYMWLLTVVCLVVAVGLVWWSAPEQGLEITIRFPEGHGLEAEDSVRFRGIEVGVVEEVKLNSQLTGVDVKVNLLPSAQQMAREGTRFWIVRPELSLSQVSGLETAVGHKYIGVLPGPNDAAPQVLFDGMAKSPPDMTDGEGTEIILRGEKRLGVSPGSPLSFRGIVIGRVLSVELARDARSVETRVRIFQKFESLVTSNSKFWSNSGIDVDMTWGSGLKVDVESVETIVKGGIAMLTVEQGGRPVQPGQLFELAASPEDEWFEKAKEIAVTDQQNLRSAVKILATWKRKRMLFGPAEERLTGVATHLKRSGQDVLIVPKELVIQPEDAIEDSFQVSIEGGTNGAKLPTKADTEDAQPLVRLAVKAALLKDSIPFEPNEIRVPTEPEKGLAIRVEGLLSDPTFLNVPIDVQQISEDWTINGFDGDRKVWHGAPVVAESDGKLIGFLIVEKRSASILPVWPELIQ